LLLWRFTYKEKERYEHCKVKASGEKEDMEKGRLGHNPYGFEGLERDH